MLILKYLQDLKTFFTKKDIHELQQVPNMNIDDQN